MADPVTFKILAIVMSLVGGEYVPTSHYHGNATYPSKDVCVADVKANEVALHEAVVDAANEDDAVPYGPFHVHLSCNDGSEPTEEELKPEPGSTYHNNKPGNLLIVSAMPEQKDEIKGDAWSLLGSIMRRMNREGGFARIAAKLS